MKYSILATLAVLLFFGYQSQCQHQVMSLNLLDKAKVELSNSTDLVRTIDFHVYLNQTVTSTSAARTLLKFNEAGNGQFLSFGNSTPDIPSETMRLQIGSLAQSVIITNVLTAGWHHIVIASDGSVFNKVYVDGNLSGTVQGSAPVFPLDEYTIGGASGNFEGRVDELRFWNVTSNGLNFENLAADEVCTSDFPSLLAYNKFEDVNEMALNELSNNDIYSYSGLAGPVLLAADNPLNLPAEGCMDEVAENYNPESNCDDGSCIYAGCTDPSASNYNPTITIDDGSCEFSSGCLTELTPESEILSIQSQLNVSQHIPNEYRYEAELVYSWDVSTYSSNFGTVAELFHNSCDGLSNTIVVLSGAKNGDYEEFVYVGYNEGMWSSNGQIQSGLDNNFLYNPILDIYSPAVIGGEHISNNPANGPDFISLYTGTWDAISDYCDEDENNYTCSCDYTGSNQLNCGNSLTHGAINTEGTATVFAYMEVWQLKNTGEALWSIIDANSNGICDAQEIGCIDNTACNYTSEALVDDGSCIFPDDCGFCGNASVLGCSDELACNYSSLVTCDNGSCLFPGCADLNACNYNSSSGCDDGSCKYPGCFNSSACNFDIDAGCDDGSCILPDGCTDPLALNYTVLAQCDDNSCLYVGCMNVEDANYNPMATFDDGSCFSYNTGCAGDFNGDGSITVSDLGGFLGAFGTTCE